MLVLQAFEVYSNGEQNTSVCMESKHLCPPKKQQKDDTWSLETTTHLSDVLAIVMYMQNY